MGVASGGGGPGSKSPVKIMANIFISFIGAGVLGLPYAFKEAGVIEGVTIMTLVGMISVKSMLLIIDCKHMLKNKQKRRRTRTNTASSNRDLVNSTSSESEDNLLEKEMELANGITHGTKIQIDEPTKPEAPGQELNYGDVGYYAIGSLGRILVDGALLISQVGFCCAYLIFISENLSDYIKGVSLIQWLAILLPPLSFLTLLRHLSSLAYCSLFAQFSNLMAFAVVFWFDFEHFSKIEIHPKKISLEGFPFFLAVAIYCYEGAGMILSLESSLHKDIRKNFKLYFKVTLLFVTMLYISFGTCGYLSFGPETNAVITLNLPKGSSLDFAVLVKICLCLGLFFTYPIMMFPVIELLEKKLLPSPDVRWQGNILRFLMVGLSGAVVLAIPDFANLMALVGATCCTLLAFTLPGLFHLQIYRKCKGQLANWKVALDIFLIILGVVGALVGTWDAIKRLQEFEDDIQVDYMNDTDVTQDFLMSHLTSLSEKVFKTSTPSNLLTHGANLSESTNSSVKSH